MSTFLELAKKRYSVRAYQEKPVEQEKLEKILEAARVAPTGANKQPHRLIVVREPEGLRKLSKAADCYGAPLAVLVCCDTRETWKRPFDQKRLTDIDASIVTDHMMLAAADLGLGSVWICYFKPDVIRREFDLPDYLEPVNILALGYSGENAPAANRHETGRKPLSETVFYETLR